MTRRLTAGTVAARGDVDGREPDDEWLRLHPRGVPVDVLTAVVDGEVAFGDASRTPRSAGAPSPSAPDGTRWAGLSSVHVAEDARRRGLGRALCDGAAGLGGRTGRDPRLRAGARRTTPRRPALYESMGFAEHHRSRYVSLG